MPRQERKLARDRRRREDAAARFIQHRYRVLNAKLTVKHQRETKSMGNVRAGELLAQSNVSSGAIHTLPFHTLSFLCFSYAPCPHPADVKAVMRHMLPSHAAVAFTSRRDTRFGRASHSSRK